MRIAVVFRADYQDGVPVPAYPWSYVDAFREMGHEVFVCGEGHPARDFGELEPPGPWAPDFILEIENGRNEKGELRFIASEGDWIRFAPEPPLRRAGTVPKAVLFYDTHGHPDLHAELAKKYDHVFFGSWCKRDLFAGHKSAHWCPSATDLRWFGTPEQRAIVPTIDVGFFGSKRGLSRAHDLIEICKANGWTYDVRQVASNRNVNRWPATGEAMARCRVLFNRGQKHDGPNQRVMESMAMGRPLLTDLDPRDGMRKLFGPPGYAPHDHFYYAYDSGADMEAALFALLRNETLRKAIASIAKYEVEAKHLIKHRAAQILEVVNA